VQLIVRRDEPLNCESSLSTMTRGVVMSNADFYIRNHFPTPTVDTDRWRLRLDGLVLRPLNLQLNDLLSMPAKTMAVTLECAGNGRSLMSPPVEGEQWDLGAVSTAEWTGVPLADVLTQAGVFPAAREIVMRGADSAADPSRDPNRFERSLALSDMRASPVLLAYAMNGEPLPKEHGYPVRAIVPGWYAVNSVKWLTHIELIGGKFEGHFQASRYVYESKRGGDVLTEPVRHQRVRALITQPEEGDTVSGGRIEVRGLAWSGVAPIAQVEVSLNGEDWQPARMLGQPNPYCWQPWELIIQTTRPRDISIRARAVDEAGRTQPDQGEWNRLGYGNNSIQEIKVRAA
jgi:DMSO/TMAO reductase YedYZ molybdopterin-dependent catalytic subunit